MEYENTKIVKIHLLTRRIQSKIHLLSRTLLPTDVQK